VFAWLGFFDDLLGSLFGRVSEDMENDEWERSSDRNRR
jgi:hypothetical protein